VQSKPSATLSRLLTPESLFSNSISISVSLDDSCVPTLPYFEDVLLFVPNSLLLLVNLTTKRISSTDTPATATCKEKLLIALHNSLLIVLLDIWEQNILVFDKKLLRRLLDFPTIGVVERNV
jgi:hypothetical protein